MPDYDGRPAAPTSAGDVALWVPRVVASPLYFTSEYLLRRPLGAITKGVEGATEDDGPKSHWRYSPIVAADLGFRPWFGLHVSNSHVFARNNATHAQAAFGGVHTLLLGLSDDVEVAHGTVLSLFGVITRRDDAIFHGFGPRSSPSDRTRFGYDRVEGGFGFVSALGPGSSFHAALGVRGTRFADPAEIATRDYALTFQGASLTLDTSDGSRPAATGIRVAVDGEHDLEVERNHSARYVRWGGEATFSLDLTGKRRVLSLGIAARFVDSIAGEAPPVTEQVVLGGDRHLRGFLYGRLVGQSAAMIDLAYEWPIWVFLDGVLVAELGDVFGKHLDGLAPRLFRSSYTLGIRATVTDATIELLGGLGTEPIADGLRVSSGRLLLAITRPL